MTSQPKSTTIDDEKVTLTNFFITSIDPSDDTGETQATSYCNGVMQACLYVKYSYGVDEEPSDADLLSVDEAMQTYFLNSNQVFIETLAQPDTPIENLGWQLSLEQNQFLNDFELDITDRPDPTYEYGEDEIIGWIRLFVTPPINEVKTHQLKVVGVHTDQGVTNTLELTCSVLSIGTSDLEIQQIAMNGDKSDFMRLLTLGYSGSAQLPTSRLKLEGIEKKGKYGITLGTKEEEQLEKQCNINMVYLNDDDSRGMGFFDHHLSSIQPGEDTFTLLLGQTGEQIWGTDFKGPEDDEQEIDEEHAYFCDGLGWEESQKFDNATTQGAFQSGVPILAWRRKHGYKLCYDIANRPRILLTEDDKLQYAFDNCGNRIAFEMRYQEREWNNDWNDGYPIVVASAYSSGGCEE